MTLLSIGLCKFWEITSFRCSDSNRWHLFHCRLLHLDFSGTLNPNNKQQVGPLKGQNGELSSDSKFMAEELNDFFAFSFTRENTQNIINSNIQFQGNSEEKLSNINVTPEVGLQPGGGGGGVTSYNWLYRHVPLE